MLEQQRYNSTVDPLWYVIYSILFLGGIVIFLLGLLSSDDILLMVNHIRPRPTGEAIAIIARSISLWGELIGMIIFLLTAILFCCAKNIDQFAIRLTSLPTHYINQLSIVHFIIIIIGFTLIFETGTFFFAYYQGDDFTHIVQAHYEPLSQLLLRIAGDHIMLFLRLQWWLMWKFFHYNLWCYRLAVILNFFLVVMTGVVFLKKLGCQGLGLLAFIVMCAGWPLWGKVTSGYFTLMVYNEVIWLAFSVFAFQLHYSHTKRSVFLLCAAVCCIVACLQGLYGMWVPIAWLIIGIIGHINFCSKFILINYLKSEKYTIASVALTLLVTSVFYYIAYDKQGGFLTMRDPLATHNISDFVLQLWEFMSMGLLVSMLVPYYYIFRDYASIIFMLKATSSVIFIIVSFIVWHHIRGKSRWVSVGLFMITIGVSMMVCIARPYSDPFYDPRHLCMPFILFCICMAFIIDKLYGATIIANAGNRLRKWIILGLAAIFCNYFIVEIAAISLFQLSNIKPSLPLRSYGLISSVERQNALEDIKQRLALIYNNQSTDFPIYIPNLDGRYLITKYPSLWEQDLAHYDNLILRTEVIGDVKFVRNDSYPSHANSHVILSNDIRKKISKVFIDKIQDYPQLNELYCSSVKLLSHKINANLPDLYVNVDDWNNIKPIRQMYKLFVNVKSDDYLVIKSGYFDPVKNRYLHININHSSSKNNNGKVTLALQFQGILNLPYHKHIIEVDGFIMIDLLQIPAYAMNPKIKKLMLIFDKSGNYNINHISTASSPITTTD
ncbi:hypothetical protein QUF75_02670 [Desulfococcaceae bacterium HSG7]|nr:hypothetical protein [Desulfococcaceae bacterium HSG7]